MGGPPYGWLRESMKFKDVWGNFQKIDADKRRDKPYTTKSRMKAIRKGVGEENKIDNGTRLQSNDTIIIKYDQAEPN